MKRIRVIDSHTGGEPTRIVVEGRPDLSAGSAAEALTQFRTQHDAFRRAVVNEPRGSEVWVGGILLPPQHPEHLAGVLFFNNIGFLGMCGHGAIGLMTTLAYLGRAKPGEHRLETPVGIVTASLHPDGRTSIRNVPSYRYAQGVRVAVPDYGVVTGDVAWGGNWFFLVHTPQEILALSRVNHLTAVTTHIRQALSAQGITGAQGAEIDHIELFGPPLDPANDSRNFVLCPGGAYDRSPCGTGTSAKMACLAADGKLEPGKTWRQESILGSVFEGTVERTSDGITPTITGKAWVNSDAWLLLDPNDPFCWGVGAVD